MTEPCQSPNGAPSESIFLRLHLEIESDETAETFETKVHPALTTMRLRRVFGKVLVDRFCSFGKPLCQDSGKRGGDPGGRGVCSLLDSCAYGQLFAPASRRMPYALHTVLPGDRLGPRPDLVEVTLFGAACALYAWVLGGLRDAVALGLGPEGQRQRWRVARGFRVDAAGSRQPICGSNLEGLPPTLRPEPLPWAWGEEVEKTRSRQQMTVDLLSPLRLLADGRLLPGHEPTPFVLLVARILDRYQGVFGRGSSELLEEPLKSSILEAAAQVPLLTDSTQWVDRPDYSARQGREMLLGGKVGQLTYGAEAVSFLSLLRAGEILHVGKNPTSGCGRIRVTPR